MIRRPPGSTRTDTLFPYTTLFRSLLSCVLLPWADSPARLYRLQAIRPLTMAAFLIAVQGISISYALGKYGDATRINIRSEEHTSELQSLMRISYAVFCLTKKNTLLNLS